MTDKDRDYTDDLSRAARERTFSRMTDTSSFVINCESRYVFIIYNIAFSNASFVICIGVLRH